MNLADAIQHADRDLRWKLRALATLPIAERQMAAIQMGTFPFDEIARREVLDALAQGENPDVLTLLAEVAIFGEPGHLAAEKLKKVHAILVSGEPPERRMAAAVLESTGVGGNDLDAAEWIDCMTTAVRGERDPAVVGALASGFNVLQGRVAPAPVLAAFREALDRLACRP
ncbi:MAG: hypothetical protein HYZ53_01570 [Planctomycetes bacterium]|nr:hypothetical protein [Planctomycetota bacterium]